MGSSDVAGPWRRGVCYDVGRSFGGPSTRPGFDERVVARELQIIRDELHGNAVRICGSDLGRVTCAARRALSLGLQAWLCPELFEHDQATTLDYIADAARQAEALRRRFGGRVVLSLGTELSVFMPGILPGTHFSDRIAAPELWQPESRTDYGRRLQRFLADAVREARRTFEGPVTYAAAPFEPVAWNGFDIACVDLYRDDTNRDDFGRSLDPAFASGKPVVVSEVGCCTYRGAQDAGGMGWAIVDYSRRPPRLDGDYERDESLQARELIDMLESLESRGVAGVFVMTFVSPLLTHHHDPRLDLDMASYSLVRSEVGRSGDAHPGLPWEPKQSFAALARHFATRRDET